MQSLEIADCPRAHTHTLCFARKEVGERGERLPRARRSASRVEALAGVMTSASLMIFDGRPSSA
jgi:hypothetical protein